ncbi:MAG: 50S ribosomal protein L21 [Coriobacteriia bacterium]|jgi:large subunit ribosomal protein L21
MYAVVNIGGKQAKVEVGSIIAVEKLNAEVGDTVSLPVLMIADGETVLATPAEIAGAAVSAKVLEHFKGEKQMIFKFKKRKGYKRTKGHRQVLTSVVILDIAAEGAAKPKAEKVAKPEAAPKKTEKAEKPAAAAAPEAPAEAARCAAIKPDGTQCANKAKEGSKYCGVHAKKLEG